ncbi:hypothetical protein HHK36_017412 [Tetracentron sinense]|uniref:Pentatricopeptide repeat-containing protein n=1 Tax=Tetracentron sinense TaxID=13715 RepID=A0A834Z595_TETSI|nr:hypothetical protein HHK36_017412 [Tetracentron sinense]
MSLHGLFMQYGELINMTSRIAFDSHEQKLSWRYLDRALLGSSTSGGPNRIHNAFVNCSHETIPMVFSIHRYQVYTRPSGSSPLKRGKSRRTHCITSILFAVYQICPFVVILSKSIGNYRSLATHASLDEQEVTDETLKQILSAVEANPSSGKETYAIYIKKLCRTGKISDAAKLLQGALDEHIFLSPNTYNLLLVAAGEVNDTDLLCQIFKNLLLSFKSLDSTSYFNLAKAFSMVNDSIQLIKFVREISELTFPRSATVIRRIISGFAEYKQIDKSLLIFDHMKNLNCKPDIITYNTVLAILGQAGRLDEMLSEFASMKESSMIPDIVLYNTLFFFFLFSFFFFFFGRRAAPPNFIEKTLTDGGGKPYKQKKNKISSKAPKHTYTQQS